MTPVPVALPSPTPAPAFLFFSLPLLLVHRTEHLYHYDPHKSGVAGFLILNFLTAAFLNIYRRNLFQYIFGEVAQLSSQHTGFDERYRARGSC